MAREWETFPSFLKRKCSTEAEDSEGYEVFSVSTKAFVVAHVETRM